MRTGMTVKSNSLSQGTRRPGVRTVRMVGHMAGDKMPWSRTVKFPGSSLELLPLNRWSHDPSEGGEGCGSGMADPQTLQGVGHGEGPHLILSFSRVALLGRLLPTHLWGVIASPPFLLLIVILSISQWVGPPL